MSAFTPTSAEVAVRLVAALLFVLAAGLGITRIRSLAAGRSLAWLLVAGSVAFAERSTLSEPPGVRMLAIIGILLYAMKAVVGVEAQVRLSPFRWLAFAALWPGMRPSLFESLPSAPRNGAAALVAKGVLRLAVGAVLIALGRWTWSATGSKIGTAALLLPGISLVLHFGLFNLAAGAWRAVGVPAESLFQAPLLSTSLREFWGRRWNIGFSEMSALAVYRPLSIAVGRRSGLVAAFLASGLLHELAISVPVKAGYGLPLAYFGLHGLAMLAEGGLQGRFGRHPGAGRIWTIAWIVLPLPLLFHEPFLRGVVWPLVGLPGQEPA